MQGQVSNFGGLNKEKIHQESTSNLSNLYTHRNNCKSTSRSVIPESYGDAGIIFVSVEDPYSRLTRSISKCEYSAIGFYAPSTSTGVLKIIVTLVDLFGVEKPTWLSSGCTLDRLIKNPLVTRLAIKPLRINSEDSHKIRSAQSKFRACICRGTEMVKKPSLEETIFSLFGYRPNGSHPCVTGIDLVNQVITLYGEMDRIHPGSSISLSTLDELQKIRDHPDQLSVIGMMGLPFSYGDEAVDISSYIVDTNLFGDLIEIPLPQHNPLIVEAEKQKMLNLYRPYLTKGLSTFVDLLLTRPDFFVCVTKLLKAGRKFAQSSEKILYQTLLNFSEISEDVLVFLTSLQEKGNYDREELNQIKDRLEQEYFTSCLYLDKEPKIISSSECKDANITSPELEALKNWTQQLVDSVKANETSCRPAIVDMSQLVSLVNKLTHSEITLPQFKKTPALLEWSSSEKYSPSQHNLRSGKTIYLDRYSPNLDALSSDDLIELSSHLNSLDESYDSLREAVSQQLTSLHDITEV